MRSSSRLPAFDNFPSPPSSEWSCTSSQSPSSANQNHPSPPTPDSGFSPIPTVVGPEEFALQIDLQLDKVVSGSLHTLPQPSVASPKTDSCFLSEDDMSNLQAFLRNAGRRENVYDRLESSPPLRPRNARVSRVSRHSPSDDFSFEAPRSALVNPNELSNPSHCSLLIQEVSLLVGLTGDDGHDLPDDGRPPVPDQSKQAPDILPFGLTPTKSLAPHKQGNAGLPHPPTTNVRARLSDTLSINPCIDNASLRIEKPPSVRSTDFVMPIAHRKSENAIRPSLSPHRRRGQLFNPEPSLGIAHHRNAVVLDETFSHPREPPPKPTLDSLANRRSPPDRLEYSLRKLEAYAPANHRKSQSDGRSSDHVSQRRDKCPSLTPPRRLRKQRSNHENTTYSPSHHALGCLLSGSPPPLPRSTICPAPLLDDEHQEITPVSFMDMDIPHMEMSQKQQASSMSKNKMKGLVNVAKRLSRGMIAWGKNLAGTTKPSVTAQETTIIQNARF